MTERPLPPVWGQGLYAAADGLGEWVRRSGYEPCHAEQRGWLACEWHERTIDVAGLPPRLVLVWDARSAALEWLGLATPVRRGGSGGGAEFGLQRRGPVLIPAPPAPDGPTEPDERCPRHSKLTTGDIWAVLTLDLPTTSPHALQTALLRLGQTWADLREPVVEQQHWWQSLDKRYDDFPELPWWVQDVARANESQRVRVFRGTAGIYWNFNDFQGRWRADHADWVKWVESEEVSDHATYYRWAQGAAPSPVPTAGPRSTSPHPPWKLPASSGTRPRAASWSSCNWPARARPAGISSARDGCGR